MTPEELAAIRERDAHAVARLGDPDIDPLLRAEMDRRALLAEVDRLLGARSTLIALASGEQQAGLTGTSVARLEHTTRAAAYELAVRIIDGREP